MPTTTKKPGHRTAISQYATYSFKDKDPVIDQLRTIVDDAGESYSKIHDICGVSTTTLYNWFSGETRRPQFASIMAVARACGYDIQIVRTSAADRPNRAVRFRRKGNSSRAESAAHH